MFIQAVSYTHLDVYKSQYQDGDRDFSFYRNPGADMMLKEDEIPTELIKNSKIFHFGTLSMTHDGRCV